MISKERCGLASISWCYKSVFCNFTCCFGFHNSMRNYSKQILVGAGGRQGGLYPGFILHLQEGLQASRPYQTNNIL